MAGFYLVGFMFARFVVLSPVGCGVDGNPAKSAAHRGARSRRWRLQAGRVCDCRNFCRLRRRVAGNFSELHAAGRLRSGHVGAARHPDRDRRRRNADRPDRRRGDLAYAPRFAATGAGGRRSLAIHSRLCLRHSRHFHAERDRRRDHAVGGRIGVPRPFRCRSRRRQGGRMRARAKRCWRRCRWC